MRIKYFFTSSGTCNRLACMVFYNLTVVLPSFIPVVTLMRVKYLSKCPIKARLVKSRTNFSAKLEAVETESWKISTYLILLSKLTLNPRNILNNKLLLSNIQALIDANVKRLDKFYILRLMRRSHKYFVKIHSHPSCSALLFTVSQLAI